MSATIRQGRNLLRLSYGAAFRRSFGSQGYGHRSSGTSVALTAAATAALAGGVYYLDKRFQIISGVQLLPTLDASAPTREKSAAREQTFIMIKPDGVARGLVADIIKRFEQRGYKLVAMKLMIPTPELLNEHYADLSARPFFPGLVRHVSSGPVVAMVWEGKNVVAQGRAMLGETDPLKSKPGSIRGDFSIDMGRNIIHGSDSVETAKKEISLWFAEKEVLDWSLPAYRMVYE